MEYRVSNQLTEDGKVIRQKVFVEEQGYQNEFDVIDKSAIHIVVYREKNPIAAGRIFFQTREYHIGRVAVLSTERGKGTGIYLIESMEQEIKKKGGEKAVLSAQEQAVTFYQKCGYHVFGDIKYDEGNPHWNMEKIL